MIDKQHLKHWQANFYAGLALVLPAVISLAIVKWLFGTVSTVTDTLLFFLPYLPIDDRLIYVDGDSGEMLLPWSLLALAIAVAIIALIGRFARHFVGKKMITVVDYVMLKVPLLNKIYGAIKQVNEAFTSNKRSSFKQVVLVEFPKDGVYSVGFLTGDEHGEVQHRTSEQVVSVFVPTTPNPTTGFLILVPTGKVTRLQMSVADGIKLIMSLGSVSPAFKQPASDPDARPKAVAREKEWTNAPLV